ncbi:short chain dehydrogenase [Kordia sp. SMS9]|uniref:SDR family oxidoreductase n=1 Tax=Kordia sp. SMS9 TaxID=2282170 RepID=UPI000E0D8930|nr:SDR family oxidoreductase [Kordia sp. SMS9]AXG70704.1 short chain dehydrogenase [Kordia sp. SMS9]
MNIILTGVTGTLGSQILIQLLKQEKVKNCFLLVREKNGKTPQDRIQNIFHDIFQNDSNDEMRSKIKIFNSSDFFTPSYLTKTAINYFIHAAGYVNLSIDIREKAKIFEENLAFTKKIFQTFSPYLTKFIYISTAFSIGDVGGFIGNDFHNGITPKYRNFYEESKHQCEKYLLENEQQSNVSIQILRPSVLGGNISEEPKYFISKFMVYYLLGKFFYKSPLNGDIVRIVANFNTGLNIIPVDYVAHVISEAIHKNIAQLNITHSKCTGLIPGMTRIIETAGASNFTFVNSVDIQGQLRDKNRVEQFYYNSLGMHLNPYLVSAPYEYDTEVLESIVPMPSYNLVDYLEDTISYAKEKKFRNKRW